jgi:hypothetical protein
VILLTSDIHLNDKPLDAYRWDLFPWLKEQVRKYKVDTVGILGDLTDAKDRHSAVVTNKLADGVHSLTEDADVLVLKANHDYIDKEWPFFRFLRNMPRVDYISEPTALPGNILALPHTNDYEKDWAEFDFTKYWLILCHQTFSGARSENDTQLRGVPPSVFAGIKAQVWSGDIHVPQRVGKNIEYVGSPYRVHFGDVYIPRVVLLEDDLKPRDLHFPCINRHVVDIQGEWGSLPKFAKGDQVKVRVHLPRSEFSEWPKLRETIRKNYEELGWQLCGLELLATPEKIKRRKSGEISTTRIDEGEILMAFIEKNKLEKELAAFGQSVLKEGG